MIVPHGMRRAAEQVVRYSRLIWERGWVANHDGNVSVRLDARRFLATPTGESKRVIDESMLVVVDLSGKVLQGDFRIFSEWNLHAAAYETRPDVTAVVHAHPPHATAAGLSGLDLADAWLPEVVVSLGAVPTAEAALPGGHAAAAVRDLVEVYDAMLLPGNGALTVGDDLEQAYLRMELVEHLAHIVGLALQQGGARTLPDAAVRDLLEKRTKAGLGPEARRRKAEAKAGQGRRPQARAAAGGSTGAGSARSEARGAALARAQASTGDARVARIVADEVVKLLGDDGKR